MVQDTPALVKIKLGATPEARSVPANVVEKIELVAAAENADFKLKVGRGAGAFLILKSLPAVLNLTVEVFGQAQFTLAYCASAKSTHELVSTVRLVEDGASALVLGAFIGQGASQLNAQYTLEHNCKNTYGRMIMRRVGYDSSRSQIRGMLRVAPGANGTDTYLSDKALLLSADSRAESIPGLEIKANDVKASHGATVGQISPDELFYLRSRGLPELQATQLLVRAFLAPALVGVSQTEADTLAGNLENYDSARYS